MSYPDSIPPVPPSDSSHNPYATPQSEILATNPDSGNLAKPWVRLVAQLIDGLTVAPVNLILTFMLLRPDQAAIEAAEARGDFAGALSASSPPFFLGILVSAIVLAVLIAINWKFLPNGQTIGKKVMKIQIRSRDGSLLPVNTLITKRMLPLYVVASIPMIGPLIALVDVLCIFRPGRNTLHDDLANSKVVVQ